MNTSSCKSENLGDMGYTQICKTAFWYNLSPQKVCGTLEITASGRFSNLPEAFFFCALKQWAAIEMQFDPSIPIWTPLQGKIKKYQKQTRKWPCIRKNDSTWWSSSTMISSKCRCWTLLNMLVDIFTVVIWQGQEWTPKPYNILWCIRSFGLRWILILILDLMMPRMRWSAWGEQKAAKKEIKKVMGKKTISQKVFKVI